MWRRAALAASIISWIGIRWMFLAVSHGPYSNAAPHFTFSDGPQFQGDQLHLLFAGPEKVQRSNPQANRGNRQNNGKNGHDAFIVTPNNAIRPLEQNQRSGDEGGAILLISIVAGAGTLLWVYKAISRP